MDNDTPVSLSVIDQLTAEQFAAHVQRVEMLADLVTSMMKALVDTPLGAMLPPDLVKQARSL